MRLKDFWVTAFRRWYLVLIAVICSAGATMFVISRVGPTYEADGAALVFPPTSTVERGTELETVGNPYLNLQGVTLARDIVIRALTSKSTRDELAEATPGSTFEATPDFVNSAPIILVSVEAGSPTDATSLLSTIMDRIPGILDDLQSGLNLPDEALITSKALIADSQPDPVYKDQIRAGIVTLVGALGLSLLTIGLIDGLLSGRRQGAGERRTRTKAPVVDTAPDAAAGTSPTTEAAAAAAERPMQAGSRRMGMRAAHSAAGAPDRRNSSNDARGDAPSPVEATKAGHASEGPSRAVADVDAIALR